MKVFDKSISFIFNIKMGYETEEMKIVMKLNNKLVPIMDKWQQLTEENKIMRKFISNKPNMKWILSNLISKENLKLLQTLFDDSPFKLKGTGAENEIQGFIHQLIRL